MMDYDKLIERLRTESLYADKACLEIMDLCMDAAFAIETLRADLARVTAERDGRWTKPVPGDGESYCSVCKVEQPWFYGYGYFESDYCPNCGACMDKEN